MAKAPVEIRSLARAHTAAAIRVLASIMNQAKASPAARVSAAVALLDRGWGKPSQTLGLDPKTGPVGVEATLKWSDRDLARRLALILSSADAANK